MCIIVSSYICKHLISEVWINISHAHFKTKVFQLLNTPLTKKSSMGYIYPNNSYCLF